MEIIRTSIALKWEQGRANVRYVSCQNVVVTGDETHLFSYMLAMGVSGLMLAFLEIDDRKKKHKA